MASPLHDWIEALPEKGRYVFTRADADAVTDASAAAIKMTLYRLKKSGAIDSPKRDYADRHRAIAISAMRNPHD